MKSPTAELTHSSPHILSKSVAAHIPRCQPLPAPQCQVQMRILGDQPDLALLISQLTLRVSLGAPFCSPDHACTLQVSAQLSPPPRRPG